MTIAATLVATREDEALTAADTTCAAGLSHAYSMTLDWNQVCVCLCVCVCWWRHVCSMALTSGAYCMRCILMSSAQQNNAFHTINLICVGVLVVVVGGGGVLCFRGAMQGLAQEGMRW